MSERIYNSVQKDYVTFLETSADSGGKKTRMEVELSPGGGVALHFHTRFTETFKAIKGDLSLQVDKDVRVLRNGETFTADIGVLHRFFNASSEPIVFEVTLSQGNTEFENALRAGYGLASEGKTNNKSIPKNPLDLAVLADWSNTVYRYAWLNGNDN